MIWKTFDLMSIIIKALSNLILIEISEATRVF